MRAEPDVCRARAVICRACVYTGRVERVRGCTRNAFRPDSSHARIVAMYQWWNVGPIDNAWLAALAISAKAEVPPPLSA